MQLAPIQNHTLLAAATVVDGAEDTLTGVARDIRSGTHPSDRVVLDAFDDAYVQAAAAATLLETAKDPAANGFAAGVRQALLGAIATAKAASMDTVVDPKDVLALVSAARNEALAIAQELRAASFVPGT